MRIREAATCSFIVDQAVGREQGKIDWRKVWKSAKMAFKYQIPEENQVVVVR
jgi:hypothetical protein